ncbi:LicD family protein [Proteus mirabilis]|nr:LicD family protein [Proteus mirabilis]
MIFFFLQTVTTDKDYIFFINIPCKLRINNTEIVEKNLKKYIIAIMKKSHHGLFVDIFPYDKYSENKK